MRCLTTSHFCAPLAGVGLILALGAEEPTFAQNSPRSNRVIERFLVDEPAIGTFTRNPAPNLDFTVIDTQYGNFNLEDVRSTLAEMRIGNRAPDVIPIVRIPYAMRHAPEGVVDQLLNLGVSGVMFPDIETADQARRAIGAMRFRNTVPVAPLGLRNGNFGVAPSYWGLTDASYREAADVWPLSPSGQLLAILQIESLIGIEQLDAILATPGLSAIFLGPTDLAAAIGAEGPQAPQVEVLVQQVLAACLAADIACGYPIVATSPEAAERETARRLSEGFELLAVMTIPR